MVRKDSNNQMGIDGPSGVTKSCYDNIEPYNFCDFSFI